MTKKKCEECRKKFRPKTEWQKFCSDNCRIKAHRAESPRKVKPYTFN